MTGHLGDDRAHDSAAGVDHLSSAGSLTAHGHGDGVGGRRRPVCGGGSLKEEHTRMLATDSMTK